VVNVGHLEESEVFIGNGNHDLVNVNTNDSSRYGVIIGNGDYDTVNVSGNGTYPVSVGNGDHDTVTIDDNHYVSIGDGNYDTIKLINTGYLYPSIDGNHDKIVLEGNSGTTVGNGNDTIYFNGSYCSVSVGVGHDRFVFEPTAPGTTSNNLIVGFDPAKDSLTFPTGTALSYHTEGSGNTLISVDHSETIALLGVLATELHPQNFHFEPAAQLEQQLHQLAAQHAHHGCLV
jgi:hypothetical protein